MKYHKMATVALMVALLMTVVIAVSASAQTVTASGAVNYTGLPMNGFRIATQPAGESVFAGAKPLQSLQPLLSTSPKMIQRRTPAGSNAKPGNGQGAPMAPDTPGRALFMASERTERLGTCLPSMTLTLNAVRPGEAQRLHRHNAAALVLALHEARCASTIGGQTFPWTQYVTLLTPAGAEHDHRNAPTDRAVTDGDVALALIVQDGGLYYYGRTMGFAFSH